MIIVELTGGLGNQLFQYATGMNLSIQKKVPLLLDLSWFNSQNKRKYQLDLLNISSDTAHISEVKKIKNRKNNKIIEILNRVSGGKIPWLKSYVFIEKNSGHFDNNLFSCPKNCFIRGYWQSEKYFLEIKETIRKEFTLKKDFSVKVKTISAQMRSDTNSVSVHVRRGDYVKENIGHCVTNLDYYYRAIEFLTNQGIDPKFYVNSDDIEWARENLSIFPGIIFIDRHICNNDAEELLLMSHCHHHINANSSFSWWSAWLNEQEDSIVTVPNKWFSSRPFPEDRIPNRWYRL